MKHDRAAMCLVTILSVFVAVLGLGICAVHADAGSDMAEQYLKKEPITKIDANWTMEQAIKVQEQFVAALEKTYGKPVGYKAGLTNPNIQKVFGVSQPVRGTLLEKMLLQSGASVPANFGSIPRVEGDLLVRVGSDEISQAKTAGETLKYLDAVIPFLELPDGALDAKVKPTAPILVAINVGARLGVMGTPIPLSFKPEWSDQLKNFTVQVFDETGAMVGDGKGTAMLGDPLAVVLWIKDSLAAEGKKLKKGDLLSLGSLTKMLTVKPGNVLKAKYVGLDPKGPVEISVSFK